MQYTYELETRLADERTSVASSSAGRFVRVFAVVGLAVYAAFAVTALVLVPGIAQSPVVWAPLAMTLAVAGLTFYTGHRLGNS
jgi:hypothetical protein